MKTPDVIASAISNTFRSKTRTVLTILAIFIGAFTLTITTGLGAGINGYINQTVSQIGTRDLMTVTHTPATEGATLTGDAPQKYNPSGFHNGGPDGDLAVDPITADDLDAIRAISGVISVEPIKQSSVDYIQADADPYEIRIGARTAGVQVPLVDGAQPDSTRTMPEVAIPRSFVAALGFASNADAIGKSVTFGLTDMAGNKHTITATVVGIAEEAGLTGNSSAAPNRALADALYIAQNTGAPDGAPVMYGSAAVTFDPNGGETAAQSLKDKLAETGFEATTLDDTLGEFTSIIDAIVLVLNTFAIIALLAAGFGIANTLYMSVLERTREIGLMRAMGMGRGKVFGLFSYEATFIGFLGSVIGVGVGLLTGLVVGGELAGSLFPDLPGLTLFGFDPGSVAAIVLLVMGIAFVAGTLPATRAARQNPIDSLRDE